MSFFRSMFQWFPACSSFLSQTLSVPSSAFRVITQRQPLVLLPTYCNNSNAEGSSLQLLNSVWLFAAPKSKVTRSKKRMRLANKGLKNINNLKLCSKCGKTKLLHHLCMDCYRKGALNIYD